MRKFLLILLSFVCFYGIISCGGGGGDDAVVSYGADINSSWEIASLECNGTITDGTFSASETAYVEVAEGVMSECVNATENPTFTAITTLPDGFDIDESIGDQNVTVGGVGYDFNINGTMGFDTNDSDSVMITLPFDLSSVPGGDWESYKIFVRIFNHDDNSLVELTGILDIDNQTVTVETRGLPSEFTVAVIYNTNMRTISSTAPSFSISKSINKNVTNEPPWPSRNWCAIFNVALPSLITAVSSKTGIASPTEDDIKNAVQTYITAYAADVQITYETAGFRAPNLYIANATTDPCNEFGDNPRYNIYVRDAGSAFQPSDRSEIISPDGNRYGRLYIGSSRIADKSFPTSVLGSSKSSVAHEMLHAIQNGYEIYGKTAKGYREGSATTYGVTIDNSGIVSVRSAEAGETKLMSDYLTINERDDDTVYSYANQDFFAYVGKKDNAESFAYLAGLFEKMHEDIQSQIDGAEGVGTKASIKAQPPRSTLFTAMDSYFQSGLVTEGTLKNIYLDFLRQRVFDHNTESRFGRTNETTSGFAENLFQTSTDNALNSIVAVSVNAENCNITNNKGKFVNVAPFAARAVKITTSTASSSSEGALITLTLTPSVGSIGDTFAGFAQRKGVTATVADSNEFGEFGVTTADGVTMSVANVTSDRVLDINYEVTCEEKSTDDTGDDDDDDDGGAGDLISLFTLTSFTLPDETFEPVWVAADRNISIGWSFIAAFVTEVEVSDGSGWNQDNYLYLQFSASQISGPGTYTVDTCLMDSDSSFTHAAGAAFAIEGGNNAFCPDSGTLTLTEFGTDVGSHITGSVQLTMSKLTDNTKVGNVNASFDFMVGSSNAM